ncbi:hypothetical protein NDU88_007192 [Pleurodeles waltl]|uniref:Uncharacterized protein n=1 Tax=Pleurodeles waltl TaxID=8319 RepID=A0AAV7RR09_PLEWA|nr:hypothetical protein NDU88_007192 [Pleurodeles waltl]
MSRVAELYCLLAQHEAITFQKKFIYGVQGARGGYCCAFVEPLSTLGILTKEEAGASCLRRDSTHVTEERLTAISCSPPISCRRLEPGRVPPPCVSTPPVSHVWQHPPCA